MAHNLILIVLLTITFSRIHSTRISKCLNEQEALKTLSKSALEGCLTKALSPSGPAIALKECLTTALDTLLASVKTCLNPQPSEAGNVNLCLPKVTEVPLGLGTCIATHAEHSQNLPELKSCLQEELGHYLQGTSDCLKAAINESPTEGANGSSETTNGGANESSETTNGAVKFQTMLSGWIVALGLSLMFIKTLDCLRMPSKAQI